MAEAAGILGVKSWRQRKGISLESIAASTKLSQRMLEAIEIGDFKRLPGGIYNTNYIRQYAKAIGFDEVDLLAYYTAACEAVTTQSRTGQIRPAGISGPLFQH